MLIGYARVSTDDQNLDLQRDALKMAGCERIFEDTGSGANSDRTDLGALMNVLRAGDTVVIWRLDRLGRCDTSVALIPGAGCANLLQYTSPSSRNPVKYLD